jgi:putative SOS response-associated peptidase YedK
MLRWGLIPPWATDAAVGARMINARAESVADKPAYRRPFREKRCLIPSDGFYEWQHRGARKQPFFIRLKEQPKGLFAMAGLWESWQSAAGDRVESFTIVTTAANEVVRPVHDRMPLILDPKQYDAWLDPAVKDPAALQPLLQPFPAERLVAVPVGTLVNDPQNDGPQCIEPSAEPPAPPAPSRRAKKDDGQQLLF